MNRREVVKLGVLGLCGACGGGGDDPPLDAFDGGGVAMCGADLCVDLAHAANAALTAVDGARSVNADPHRLIIVRTAATPATFAVLTRICTHNGCSVAFAPGIRQFRCPCHGSRFALDGSVTNDPATQPLKDYAHVFDEATQTLTITLA